MCKLVQKNMCSPKKLAQLEKICTDDVTYVTLFLDLWAAPPGPLPQVLASRQGLRASVQEGTPASREAAFGSVGLNRSISLEVTNVFQDFILTI